MSLCSYYDAYACRSCSWIELSYEDQIKRKEDSLHRLLDIHYPQEWRKSVMSPIKGFRNKAKMVAFMGEHGITLGLGEGESLCGCPLYDATMQKALRQIETWLRGMGIKAYDLKTKKGELKYLHLSQSRHANTLMARFVLRSPGIIPRLEKGLSELMAAVPELRVVTANIQPIHMAVLEGEKEIYLTEEKILEEQFNGVNLYIRPKSFFQTNPQIAAQLYQVASDWIDEGKPSQVWDLFCGVGGFALHAARRTPMTVGIEIEPEAIECAHESAQKSGIEGLKFDAMDALSFTAMSGDKPDTIIVNPPRRGLRDQLCKWIERILPQTIIYSSCNAQSLSDDLKMLPSFSVERVQMFDMFPHTGHYEVLVLLKRQY